MHIATGGQDGLVKIFDTCQPSSSSIDIKVSSGMTDGITKINWVDTNKILVGKKDGTMEVWDIRDGQKSPSLRCDFKDNFFVIDMEISHEKDLILAASGKHVSYEINRFTNKHMSNVEHHTHTILSSCRYTCCNCLI